MISRFAVCFLLLMPGGVVADDTARTTEITAEDLIFPGDSVNLSEFVWLKRPLIVFADSPADPRFVEQMELINANLDDLAERDVIVLTDTSPQDDTALRDELHPRGFMLALIGKDGTIFLRKPLPWDVREISRVIDKMPMRQREIQERRGDS